MCKIFNIHENITCNYLSSGAIILIISFLISVNVTSTYAQDEIAHDEFTVKAAYLYNFLSFINWNTAHQSQDADTIRITILDKNQIQNSFTILNQRKFRNKPILVNFIDDIDSYKPSDLVYISSSFKKQYKTVCSAVNKSNAVLIGEGDDFLDDGGIIGFVIVHNNVRFILNLKNAADNGITISSQLIQLAHYVIQ